MPSECPVSLESIMSLFSSSQVALSACVIALPLPSAFGVTGAPEAATAIVGPDADRVEVSIQTDGSLYYGLEGSSNLQQWYSLGAAEGDGGLITFSVPLGDEVVFFRFVMEDNGHLSTPQSFSFSNTDVESFSTGSRLTAAVLGDAGIDDSNELLNRFRSAYRLNEELDKLHAAGVEVDSGQVVNLLREVELRANLQALVGVQTKSDGMQAKAASISISQGTVDGLVRARMSMEHLYAMLSPIAEPAAGATSAMQAVKAVSKADDGGTGLDRRSAEAMMEVNNRLREVGAVTLDRAAFVLLRDHVGNLAPLAIATVRGTNQDTLEGRQDITSTPAARELSIISRTPEDIGYIPTALRSLNQARVLKEPLPLTIIGTRIDNSGGIPLPVDVGTLPPFTTDVEGTDYRTFIVNRPCLAFFRAYGHAKGGTIIILDSAGNRICDASIPAQTVQAIAIPIGTKQACEQYRIQKTGSADFRLIAMNDIVSLDAYADDAGLIAHGLNLAVTRGGPLGGAGWYTFHTSVPSEGSNDRLLKLQLNDDEQDAPPRRAYVVSPSLDVTEVNVTPNVPVEVSVTLENGLWQLFVLPIDGFMLEEGSDFPPQLLAGAAHWAVEDAEVSLDIDLGFAPLKTRKFIVGTLDSASFMRDGESGANRAEIKLTLTANIAPYFEDSEDFASIFGETAEYQAWQVWMQNNFSTYGITGNEVFTTGLAAIRANGDVPTPLTDGSFGSTPTAQDWMLSYNAYMRSELGRNWYLHLDSAQSLYDNWTANIVQINAMKFPMGNRYNIIDSAMEVLGYNHQTGLFDIVWRNFHPIVPVNMPQFALPKDRLAQESMPINASFSAVEMDELDKGDLFGSVIKGIVNVGMAIYSGNFVNAACSAVGMIDVMNSTLKAAEDDPLGSANYRINRSSSLHGFYGLDDGTRNSITFSGRANGNNDYMLDNALGWAKLACGAYSMFCSYSAGNIINDPTGELKALKDNAAAAAGLIDLLGGDLTDIDNLQNLLTSLAKTQALKAQIDDFFYRIREGVVEGDYAAALGFPDMSEVLNNGDDVWDDFAQLVTGVQDMRGVGQLGFNEIHSNVQFPFQPYDQRKTQGRSTVSVVDSVPLRFLTVQLDSVKVFDLQEDFSPFNAFAEVFMNTRVGVVSDATPTSWGIVPMQYTDEDNVIVNDNGSHGYATVGQTPFTAYAKKVFETRSFPEAFVGADFIQVTTENPVIMNCQWTDATGNNAAAVFVEVGIYEDDGATCDDDMIGVYSQTFLLEDIINEGHSTWEKISDDTWRLTVTDVPVFASRWLETEIEIGTDQSDRQRAHNVERLEHPSALVSLHVDVTLGAFVPWVDNTDYDLRGQESDGELSAELNPRVAATATGPVIDQILAVTGNTALTHRPRPQYWETDDATLREHHFLDLWHVDTETPAITQLSGLPVEGWAADEWLPFHTDNYLHAALVQGGDYVAVLSEGGLGVYDMRGETPVRSSFVDMSDMYPSRLAVDAQGDLIYVSLRDYSKDLRVYTINNKGQLAIQAWYDDLPRTIAGLIPLPEGGLIAHYVGNTETDCHDYGDEYWDDPDDILGGYDESFDNSNGFLHLRRDGGLLTVAANLNIDGEVSQAQMIPVCKRNQSSMFRLFDNHTLIARSPRQEFAVRLDSQGFFTPMASVNSNPDGFYVSNMIGTLVAGEKFSAGVPTRLVKGTSRQYALDEHALTPACVYNSTSMESLHTATPLVFSVEMFPMAGGNGHLVLTASRVEAARPGSYKFELNGARIGTYKGLHLTLVDLHSTATGDPGDPGDPGYVNHGSLTIPHDNYWNSEHIAWSDNDTVLLQMSPKQSTTETLCVVDASNPGEMELTGSMLPQVNEFLDGFSDGSVLALDYGRILSVYKPDADYSTIPYQQITLTSDTSAYHRMARVPGRDMIVVVGSNKGLHLIELVDGVWTNHNRWTQTVIKPDRVAVSHDGKTIAVGGISAGTTYNPGAIEFYDLDVLETFLFDGVTGSSHYRKGTWLASCANSDSSSISHMAFTPDDSRLFFQLETAVSGNQTVFALCAINTVDIYAPQSLWRWTDVNAGKFIPTPDGNGLIIQTWTQYGEARDPDTGESVTTSFDGLVILDVSNRNEVSYLGYKVIDGLSGFALSPDGKQVAAASEHYTDAASWTKLDVFQLEDLYTTEAPDPEPVLGNQPSSFGGHVYLSFPDDSPTSSWVNALRWTSASELLVTWGSTEESNSYTAADLLCSFDTTLPDHVTRCAWFGDGLGYATIVASNMGDGSIWALGSVVDGDSSAYKLRQLTATDGTYTTATSHDMGTGTYGTAPCATRIPGTDMLVTADTSGFGSSLTVFELVNGTWTRHANQYPCGMDVVGIQATHDGTRLAVYGVDYTTDDSVALLATYDVAALASFARSGSTQDGEPLLASWTGATGSSIYSARFGRDDTVLYVYMGINGDAQMTRMNVATSSAITVSGAWTNIGIETAFEVSPNGTSLIVGSSNSSQVQVIDITNPVWTVTAYKECDLAPLFAISPDGTTIAISSVSPMNEGLVRQLEILPLADFTRP